MTKIELIKEAKSIGFEGLFEKEWLHNSREKLRFLFWMEEFKQWFRDKKQIFINVETDRTSDPKFCYSISTFIGNPKDLGAEEWSWKESQHEFFLYRTYEHALEEGLIEAIKQIK